MQGSLPMHVPAPCPASSPLLGNGSGLPPYTSGPMSIPLQQQQPPQQPQGLLTPTATSAAPTQPQPLLPPGAQAGHMLAPPRQPPAEPLASAAAVAARSPGGTAEEPGALLWDMGRFESMVMSVVAEEGTGMGAPPPHQQAQSPSPHPQALPRLSPHAQSSSPFPPMDVGPGFGGGLGLGGAALPNGPDASLSPLLAAEGGGPAVSGE